VTQERESSRPDCQGCCNGLYCIPCGKLVCKTHSLESAYGRACSDECVARAQALWNEAHEKPEAEAPP
jgi:hypothetical protein